MITKVPFAVCLITNIKNKKFLMNCSLDSFQCRVHCTPSSHSIYHSKSIGQKLRGLAIFLGKSNVKSYGKTGNKRATCFATLLQNKLKSDVACFTNHVQTCLLKNEVVASCVNTCHFAALSQNKLHVFVAHFTVPYDNVDKSPALFIRDCAKYHNTEFTSKQKIICLSSFCF